MSQAQLALPNCYRNRSLSDPIQAHLQWFNSRTAGLWLGWQASSESWGCSALFVRYLPLHCAVGAHTPSTPENAESHEFIIQQLQTFILKTGWNSFRADNNLICTEALSASWPSAKTSKRASKASPATTREGSLVATSSREHPMVCKEQHTAELRSAPKSTLNSVTEGSQAYHFICKFHGNFKILTRLNT